MKILVIDGQGGRIGKCIIENLLSSFPKMEIFAVGTNSIATSAMKKAGATLCATGENAVKCNAKDAHIILGPIGIGFANSMYGEITTKIAKAVSKSKAKKILVPITKCKVTVVGVEEKPLSAYLAQVSLEVELYLSGAK